MLSQRDAITWALEKLPAEDVEVLTLWFIELGARKGSFPQVAEHYGVQ